MKNKIKIVIALLAIIIFSFGCNVKDYVLNINDEHIICEYIELE